MDFKLYKVNECPAEVPIADCVEQGYQHFRDAGHKGKLVDEYSLFYDGANYYIAVASSNDQLVNPNAIPELWVVNMGATDVIQTKLK